MKNVKRISKWGDWNSVDGLSIIQTDGKWNTRSDLTGVHIDTGAIAQSPYLNLAVADKDDLSHGYMVILKNNSKFKVILVEDKFSTSTNGCKTKFLWRHLVSITTKLKLHIFYGNSW